MRIAGAAVLVATLLVAQSATDRLLTPADVEKVAGVTGVKTVRRGSQTGAGGDANFVTADGKLLLMVNYGNALLYNKARAQKEITVGDRKVPMELFAHTVAGVGDEAFASPAGPVQYVICARKGDHAVSVTTYFGAARQTKGPLLTETQLKQIAQIIFSRE